MRCDKNFFRKSLQVTINYIVNYWAEVQSPHVETQIDLEKHKRRKQQKSCFCEKKKKIEYSNKINKLNNNKRYKIVLKKKSAATKKFYVSADIKRKSVRLTRGKKKVRRVTRTIFFFACNERKFKVSRIDILNCRCVFCWKSYENSPVDGAFVKCLNLF